MSTAINNPWISRDQYLQSLYIPPYVHATLPDTLLGGDPIPPELEEHIKRYDGPRLAEMFPLFMRGAGTRFFNLPSARATIERALRAEYSAIETWLREERTARYAFDYFGGNDDPIAGYGFLQNAPTHLRYTKTVRLVVQRMPLDTYVLWTAYPLLSPRERCWLDAYDFAPHSPATRFPRIFYHFLNCYLSVTSIYLGVDAVIQGTTDFWTYESDEAFMGLHKAIIALRPDKLLTEDRNHLIYELSIRCLDETLPDFYVSRPEVLIEALQLSLHYLVSRRARPH